MPAIKNGTLTIKTPEVFLPLLEDGKRYRGAWGGRGGGKSWFFAELLVERMLIDPKLRAVCIREYQSSLDMSAKQLIEDVIERLGVQHLFRFLYAHIETTAGGIILFQGMSKQTAQSIKSLEGFSICWIEEAQSLSQRSLDLLRPTIREEGSEIWASWNPISPSDPIDQLLRGENPPKDAAVVNVNYHDNPFFPRVLVNELERDRARDPEKYQHVWKGAYLTHSEARVFKNWRVEEFETPDDALFLFGADWGYSIDPSVLVRCYVGTEPDAVGRPKPTRTLYIDREAYKVGVEIDHLAALFDTVPGARDWPIVADSARPETISYLQRHGFPKLMTAVKGKDSVKEGILFLANYDIVVHPRCVHTIDELTFYSFKTNPLTGLIVPILDDKKNHVIDSLRYAVEPMRLSAFDFQAAGMTSSITW